MVERGQTRALLAQRFDETEAGDARAVVLRLGRERGSDRGFGCAIAAEHFEGVMDAADRAVMASFGTMAEAEAAMAADTSPDQQLAVRVIRDYGLMDRREAPQFHKPIG